MKVFFELEDNPKGTAQMKGTSFQGGRIHHYEKKEVKFTRNMYHLKIVSAMGGLAKIPHFDGAVSCSVTFFYSIKQRKKWGQPKTSKPDCDNMVKLLLDVMTDIHIWNDDSQVAHLEVSKFYAEKPAILIVAEPMEGGGT